MSREEYSRLWDAINRATDLRTRREMRERHKQNLQPVLLGYLSPEKALSVYGDLYRIEMARDDFETAYIRMELDDRLREEVIWKNENVG